MPSVPHYLEQYQLVSAAYAVDIAAIVAGVVGRTGITPEAAERYVFAALDYIALDTGVAVLELPANDALLNQGTVLLAMRIYQDVPNYGGETNQIDPTFQGVYTPARLYSHLDEYWRHLAVQWGIA